MLSGFVGLVWPCLGVLLPQRIASYEDSRVCLQVLRVASLQLALCVMVASRHVLSRSWWLEP